MMNNVGLIFSVSELYRGLQLVLSKTIRIGDTKYHIKCSSRYQDVTTNL